MTIIRRRRGIHSKGKIYLSASDFGNCQATKRRFSLLSITKPERVNLITTAIAVSIGFATLENVSYILHYSMDIPFILIYGFSVDFMHAICATILGNGLEFISHRRNMAVVGSFAVLRASSTLHAIYICWCRPAIGSAWRAICSRSRHLS